MHWSIVEESRERFIIEGEYHGTIMAGGAPQTCSIRVDENRPTVIKFQLL